MNNALSAFLLMFMLSPIWLPQSASAKASTVKITISGFGLPRLINVTDPQLLDISSSWEVAFLDTSRPPLDQAPLDRPWYEVSFYSEFGKNDVRKACVLYYYPSSSTAPGLVYLPATGSLVWGLNAGTVVRQGRDGKWSYVSPSWDALIKPLIARAESAGVQPQVHEEAVKVTIDGWTKPQRGWLYVLDSRAESDRSGSRVWLFDPENAKVMGSIRAGYQPDMVLSSNGAHLYIVSGERESGELAIIDTGAGTVRRVPFPERVSYTPWYRTLPPFTSMTLSSDDKALWILGQRTQSPAKAEPEVLTFDTDSERFLQSTVPLGSCLDGKFIPTLAANQFEVLCSWTNSLHSIRLDADHHETSTVVEIPWPRHCFTATGFLSADNGNLALINVDGSIQEMDRATNAFRSTGVTGECSLPLPAPIYLFQQPRSSNGAKVYMGYGPSSPNNLARSSELRVFDTANWQQLGALKMSVPFWSAVASGDGTLIYAFAPEQHRILVIDATTLRERSKLTVGNMAASALVSP